MPNASVAQSSNTSLVFTNASATGRTGPTQSQLNTAYSGTDLSGNVTIITQGFQEWTVPYTGTYSIQAFGAQGGNAAYSGGKGASISGEFKLESGDVLKIVVGQKGVISSNSSTRGYAAGGGGGTYVVQSPYTSNSSILVIAGGGGGGGSGPLGNSTDQNGLDGSISTNGNNGLGPNGSTGGVNGNGGSAGSNSGSSSGAGFIGNSPSFIGWADGAISFVNGANGSLNNQTNRSDGGFGGGGGAGYGGGGGGGYSGGGAGHYNATYDYGGGGGGSYNLGTNQNNIAGFNIGHGKVVITPVINLNRIQNDTTISCGELVTIGYSSISVTDQLKLHYPMNGNAVDYSSNKVDGVITGSISGVLDRFGNTAGALNFPNSTTSRTLIIDSVALFNGTQDFTYSFWIRPATFTRYPMWFRNGKWGSGHNFGVRNNTTLTMNGNTVGSGTVSFVPTLNNWSHMVIIRKGDSISQWSNGLFRGNYTANNSNWGNPFSPSKPMYIGSGDATSDTYFRGDMDEFAYYDKALNQAEIIALYQSPDLTKNNYLWSTGETTLTIDVSPIVTTTYYVTITDGIASRADSVTISIAGPVKQNITATNTAICDGAATTITTASSESGMNYSLYETAGNTLVDGPTAGTGAPLSFATGNLTSTTNFYVDGATSQNLSPTGGTALDFDGSNDYVVLPSSINSQIANTITIEGWFNISSLGEAAMLVGESYLGDGNIEFMIYKHNGNLNAGFFNGGFQNNSAAMPTLNTWVHIAATYNQQNIITYYNGIEVANTAKTLSLPVGTEEWRLGRRWDHNERLDGKMDEVRIWNIARTQAEISASMYSALTGSEAGLVAYFNFEDGTGSATLTDKTSNNYNGTLFGMDVNSDWVTGYGPSGLGTCSVNSETVTVSISALVNQNITATNASVCSDSSTTVTTASSETGVNYSLYNASATLIDGPTSGNGSSLSFNTGSLIAATDFYVAGATPQNLSPTGGTALDFDGVNDHIITPLDADLDVIPVTTWEAWIYPTIDDASYNMIMSQEDGGWDRFIAINSGKFALGRTINGWVPPGPIILNTWQHIAVVYSGANIKFYLNGVEFVSGTTEGSHSSLGKFTIGSNQAGTQNFKGKMDEVRVWNVARTQAEISANMSTSLTGSEAGLVAYFNFEDGTGSATLNDKTSNNYNGTLFGMDVNADWVQGFGAYGSGSCSVNSDTVSVSVDHITAPSTTGANICEGTSALINAFGGTGSQVYKWYGDAYGNNIIGNGSGFTSPPLTTNTTYYAGLSNSGGVDTVAPVPHITGYSGNARGYYFVAPTDFTITSLYVPTDAGGINQNIAVVRFNTAPPIYSSTTNNFSTLFLAQNNATTGYIPVSIKIYAGDIIGVLGGRSAANNASYGVFSNIAINGISATTYRLGMQFNLSTTAPQNLWTESSSSKSRVNFTYTSSFKTNNCNSSLTATLVTVNSPSFSFAQDTITACGADSVNVDAGAGWASYAWSNGDVTQISTITSSGTYNVTVTDANGCTAEDSLVVGVIGAAIIQGDTTICSRELVTIGYSSISVTNQLKLHYPMNGNADDYSPSKVDGLISGGISGVPDRFGNTAGALNFPNSTATRTLIIDSVALFSGTQDFTYSFWIRPVTFGGYPKWFQNGEWNNGDNFGIRNNKVLMMNNVTVGSGSVSFIPTLNQWTHIVIRRSGSIVSEWANGGYQGDFTNSKGNVFSPSQPLFIGSATIGSGTYYKGDMDDFAYYNKALSQAEITALYQSPDYMSYTYSWSTGETTATIDVIPAQTTTYYVTTTDGISSCTNSINIRVLDTLGLDAIAQNVSAYADSTGRVYVNPTDVNNGSSAVCGIDNMWIGDTAIYCVDAGDFWFFAEDVNGNIDSAQFTLTILDSIKPTLASVSDTIIYLDANGGAAVSINSIVASSNDNCTSMLTFTASDTTFDCTDDTVLVTLSARDESGNVSYDSLLITILDTIAPTPSVQGAIVYLDASGYGNFSALNLISDTGEVCGDVTMSFSDTSISCSNTITIANCPATVISTNQVSNGTSGTNKGQSFTSIEFGAIDKIELQVWPTGAPYLVIREWVSNTYVSAFNGAVLATSNTATNMPANTNWSDMSTFIFDIPVIIDSNKKYVIQVMNGSPYVKIPGTYAGGEAYETANPSFVRDMKFKVYSCGVGTKSVTITDASGNSVTQKFGLAVLDTIVPIIFAGNQTVYLDNSGFAYLDVLNVDSASFDNCTLDSIWLSADTFTCGTSGNYTLFGTDGAGNQSSDQFYVAVLDTISPTLIVRDTTIYLNMATGTASLAWKGLVLDTLDNCSIDSVISLQLSSSVNLKYACADTGIHQVSFRTVDNSGNSTTVVSNVTVLNTTCTPPVAIADTFSFDETTTLISLTAIGYDVDSVNGDSIYFNAYSGNGLSILDFNAETGHIEFSANNRFDFEVDSQLVIKYEVVDRMGNVDSANVVINVINLVEQVYAGYGNALSFDNIDDQVTLPIDLSFNTTEFSIEAWVYWTGSTNDIDYISGKGFGQYELHTGGTSGSNSIRFIPTDQVWIDAPTGSFLPNKWNHLVGVYNPSVSLGKVYINGLDVGAISNGVNGLSTAVVNTTSDVIIGRRANGDFPFNGNIDEFKLWNKALTAKEVSQSYLLRSNQNEINLVAYLNFDNQWEDFDNIASLDYVQGIFSQGSPTFVESYNPFNYEIGERLPIGDTVSFGLAWDADSNNITFSKFAGDTSQFDIDSQTGAITVGINSNLDYENDPLLIFTYQVHEDGDNQTDTASIKVSLLDENDRPVFSDVTNIISQIICASDFNPTFNFEVHDDDPGDTSFLSVWAITSNQLLIDSNTIFIQGSNTARSISFNPTYVDSGLVDIKIYVQDPSGAIDSAVFIVYVQPTYYTYDTVSVCLWDNITVNGNSYSYSTGTVVDSLNTNFGCDSVVQTFIHIDSLLNPSVTANVFMCEDSVATLTIASAEFGVRYQLIDVNTSANIDTAYLGTGADINILIPITDTTTIAVSATGSYSAGVCGRILSDTVTINYVPNVLPTITLLSSDTICFYDSLVLSSNYYSNNLWSNGATAQSITVSDSGIYSLSVTTDGICPVTIYDTIYHHVLPVDATATAPTEVCWGDTSNISIANSEIGTDYYLYFEQGSTVIDGPISGNGSTIDFSFGPFTQDTTFQLHAQNRNCEIILTDKPTVQVNPLPVVTVHNDTNMSPVDTIQIWADGGSTYLWSDGQTGDTISITPDTNITYYVTVTSAKGCNQYDSVYILLNTFPTLNDTLISINENPVNGSFIGNLLGFDSDANDTLSYQIISGNVANYTLLNGGKLYVATPLAIDVETNPFDTIYVRVTDDGDPMLSDSGRVVIRILDLNEKPVIVTDTFLIDENSVNGLFVGTANSIDVDTLTSFSYTVIGGANTTFEINPTTGAITVKDSTYLDVETTETFELVVEVSDGGLVADLYDTTAYVINLNDINEKPIIGDSTFVINENAPQSDTIGTMYAVDVDVNTSFRYVLYGGDVSAIGISTNGILTIKDSAQFSYENRAFFEVDMVVFDGGLSPEMSDSAKIRVNIIDLNEKPILNDSLFTIIENSPNGDYLGTVLATDVDSTKSFNYTLIGGDTSAIEMDLNGVLTIKDSVQFSYENRAYFEVDIEVTDGGIAPEMIDTSTVRINVIDVNEKPVLIVDLFTIDENLSNSTIINTIVANDVDSTQTLTYAILEGADTAFAISTNGVVSVLNENYLDFEKTTSFNINVQVADGGIDSIKYDTLVYTINLNDLNEKPEVISVISFLVNENQPNGNVLGTITAQDQDIITNFKYTLYSGDINAVSIDSITGILSIKDVTQFDFETNTSFVVNLVVEDGGLIPEMKDSSIITINVLDINEKPIVYDSIFSINENIPNGTSLGFVASSDVDAVQNIQYSLIAGNVNLMNIDASTGELTVSNSSAFNVEADTAFVVDVRVTDGGLTPTMNDTATIKVKIKDLNEHPVISFISGETICSIDSTLIQAIQVYDVDSGDSAGSLSLVAFSSSSVVPVDSIFLSGTDSNRFIHVHPVMQAFGTVQIGVYVFDNENFADTSYFTLRVNRLPNTSAGIDKVICIEDTSFLVASGGISYSWSNGFNGKTAKVYPVNTTTYVVTATNSFGCQRADSVTVAVNPLPQINIGVLSSICLNDSPDTLNSAVPIGGTYYGVGVVNGVFNPTLAGIGTKSIYYLYTDSNGCFGIDTSSIIVRIVPSPVLSSFGFSCTGDTPFVLNHGSPLNGTYSGTGVINNTFNPAVSGVGTHLISYSLTLNGCIGSVTKALIVNRTDTAGYTMPLGQLCLNELNPMFTNGIPAGGVYNGSPYIAATGSFDPIAAGVGKHTVDYTFTNANNCISSVSDTVEVLSLPVVQIASIPDVCANGVASPLIGGTPSGGVYKGLGVFNGAFNPSATGPGMFNIGYSYTDLSQCTVVDTQTVTVYNAPLVQINGLSGFCENIDTFNLVSSGSPLGGYFTGKSIIDSLNYLPSTILPSDTITYAYSDVNGCSNSIDKIVLIHDVVAASIASLNSICENDEQVHLTGGLPKGGMYFGPGVDSLAGYIIPSSLTPGNFKILYSYTSVKGCIDTASGIINIKPKPVVTLASLPTVCEATTPFILTQGTPLGGSYSGFGVINEFFYAGIAGIGTDSVAYSYIAVNGCSNNATQPITVDPAPVAVASNDTSICEGQRITLVASGGNSYNWSNGETTSNIKVSPTSTQIYSVDISTSAICSVTENIKVTVRPKMNLTFNTTDASCNNANGVSTVKTNGGVGPYTYAWTSGHTTALAFGISSGLYEVTVTDVYSCESIADATVTDVDGPQIILNSLTDPDCFDSNDGSIDLDVTAQTNYNINWSNGEHSASLNNIGGGNYTISVLDDNGCAAFETYTLTSPDSLRIDFNTVDPTCGNSDGKIYAMPSGGTPGYSYNWFPTIGTTDSLVNVSSGGYQVQFTDLNNCLINGIVSLTDFGAPTILLDSIANPDCSISNGYVSILVSPIDSTYQYNWSNGDTVDFISNVGAGVYSLTVSDTVCSSSYVLELFGNAAEQPQICKVSIDTSNNNAIVNWDESVTPNAQSYNIYSGSVEKEKFVLIGTVQSGQGSIYIDSATAEYQKAFGYRITANNACAESTPSQGHKSVYLTHTENKQQLDLFWNEYLGAKAINYIVYRNEFNEGWKAIDTLDSKITTFSETDYSMLPTTLHYFVEAVIDNNCGSDNRSFSNKTVNVGNIGVDINEVGDLGNKVGLYPNPTRGNVVLYLEFVEVKDINVRIFNLQGQLIYSDILGEVVGNSSHNIDLSAMASGSYYVEVSSDSWSTKLPLIIQ